MTSVLLGVLGASAAPYVGSFGKRIARQIHHCLVCAASQQSRIAQYRVLCVHRALTGVRPVIDRSETW